MVEKPDMKKIKENFLNKLELQFNVEPSQASDKQIYQALYRGNFGQTDESRHIFRGNDSIGSIELFEEYAFGGKYQSAFVVERRVGVRYAFFLYICGE